MTAELKNWVFEWIGGSPRSMGENQSQQQHIMGVVGGAKSSMSQATSSGANARGLAKNRAPGGGGNAKENASNRVDRSSTNAEPKEEIEEL